MHKGLVVLAEIAFDMSDKMIIDAQKLIEDSLFLDDMGLATEEMARNGHEEFFALSDADNGEWLVVRKIGRRNLKFEI